MTVLGKLDTFLPIFVTNLITSIRDERTECSISSNKGNVIYAHEYP